MKKVEKEKSLLGSPLRRTVSRALLHALEGGAATATELARSVEAMFLSGRSTKRYYQVLSGQTGLSHEDRLRREKHAEYKRHYALLQRLQDQGLLEGEKIGRVKRWHITRKGISLLFDERRRMMLPKTYVHGSGVTVVSYDVPEKLRKERDCLRETLQMMGFDQAHQSVWFANKKVTKNFLLFLREHHLLECVHIFEITKTGTLKKKPVAA